MARYSSYVHLESINGRDYEITDIGSERRLGIRRRHVFALSPIDGRENYSKETAREDLVSFLKYQMFKIGQERPKLKKRFITLEAKLWIGTSSRAIEKLEKIEEN